MRQRTIPHIFRVEFDHHDSNKPGVTWITPDVRFIIAPAQFYVEAEIASIKWLWGEHTWEIQDLGEVDKIIEVWSH